jgi:hypothetical protein
LRFFLALLLGLPALAQTLAIHTEFLRWTPTGHVVAADSTPNPRELLSPAVVRNAYASFQISVESPRINYFLFVGSNPENVLRTAVYREDFTQHGQEWIPDALRPVKMPDFGVIPDPTSNIAGQTTRSYLLDVWVPADAPVGRTRLEVQLKAGTWTIWPMEVRILPAVVPGNVARSPRPLPDVAAPAAESARGPLLDYLDGREPARAAAEPPAADSIRAVIRRNAEQDIALARTLDGTKLKPALREKVAAAASGGEWYLAVRDLIHRLSGTGTR